MDPAEEVKKLMIRRAFQQDLANLVERKNAERVFKALKQKTRLEEVLESIEKMGRAIAEDPSFTISTMVYNINLKTTIEYLNVDKFIIDPLNRI